MKKVYFAGSIRGGRDDVELYGRIIRHIQQNHIVLTEHIASPDLYANEKDKAYATDRIAESIGLKPARTRQLLKELVEMGKLDSIGSTNGKRYIKRE